MVAALARRLGDLQAAEDAAAEAFAAAARAWPRDGIPPNPGGWLTVTAWRKAVDQLRRDRPVAVDPQVLTEVTHSAGEEDAEMGRLIRSIWESEMSPAEVIDLALGIAPSRSA